MKQLADTTVRREDWTEEKAYATIKFTVPPSKAEDFEKAWYVTRVAKTLFA